MATVSACTDRSGADGFSIADSAGVSIATNLTAPDSAPQWTLSTEPVVDIGVVEGDDAYEFNRVLGVARLANGNIAVLNSGSNEVRFYGADARHIRSVGRRGQGPGEFRFAITMIRARGDSLVIWDPSNQRLTWIPTDSGSPRTLPVEVRWGNAYLAGAFADASFLVQHNVFKVPSVGSAYMPLIVGRYAWDGTSIDSIGTYAGMQIAAYGDGIIGSVLFASSASIVADADGFWVGTTKGYEVARYDTLGRLRRLIRWTGPDRRVSPEDVQAAREARLAAAKAENRAAEIAQMTARPTAELFPAYEGIELRNGELWIQDYLRPRDRRPSRWLVFDPTGKLTAHVAFPPSFSLMDWGEDYVLGVERDELDVERVRMYRLERRG